MYVPVCTMTNKGFFFFFKKHNPGENMFPSKRN